LLILFNSTNISAQCVSGGNNSDGYTTVTRQVIFNTINNSTPIEDNDYSDFTAMSTIIAQTSSYGLTVNVNTDGNYTVHTIAWIDWNQDLDFLDLGESYDLGTATNVSSGSTTFSPLSITVPATANLGSTLLRISTKWNSDPTSCEVGFDGEVEDYSISVIPPLNPEMSVSGNGIIILDGDTSPSVNDASYFGSADIVSGTIEHSFTVSNTGAGGLELTGNPITVIAGTHASDFTVIAQPAISISSGGNSVFQLSFNPSASGARYATVSIANNDADEDPYNFSLQGTGTAIPEIDVQGNGVSIPDGDTSPSIADFSDFANADIYGGANNYTFTIFNSGSGDLSLTGSPVVQISGTHANNFSVTQQPVSTTITALGGSKTFQVTFDPTTTGLRQATISISSNDADESPYTFNIQGTGTINPEIDIFGNGVGIPDGDTSPMASDSTYFGTVQVGNVTRIVTYTIENNGPATLNLTGPWPLVNISGLHSGDFSVYSAPSSSIAPGASTTFRIEFDPVAAGDRFATLTVENNDLNEGDYSFDIQGLGEYLSAPLSEINVRGGVYSIPNGDAIPETADGTHFGSVALDGGTAVSTFSIDNTGSEDLVLTSLPIVTVQGSHAADFSVSQQPSSPAAPGGTVTFNVTFDPTGGGTRSAYLSIENNDSDENPYTFTIQGTGLTSPEIQLVGNGLEIVSGDASPGLTDSTYFGDVTASLGEGSVTYTINNLGSTTLNLIGAYPVAITGEAQAEYTVTTQPSASIPAGGSSDFVVRFDPNQVGLRNAALSIASNDADELTYIFAIQGNGTGPGSPLACVPNFFHIFGDNGTITYLDASTTPYSYTIIVVAGYSINGMGYNLEDGLLYGFEMDTNVPGNNIVRIDGQGTISVLSTVSIPYESWRADFNDTGDMYFWNANGTEISIFDADLGTVTSHTTNGTTWIPIDMAYLNSDGLFYGIHTTTLYIYNPANHNVSTMAITGRLAEEFATGTNSSYYGAAWSANDGYVYTTNSQSGRMYKINVGSGESVYVGQAEANLNKSDGASCPLSAAPLPATGSIGNGAWIDANGNSIQDATETGLPGISVNLYTIDGTYIATNMTDENGQYVFQNLSPSEYYLIFSGAPAGFMITAQDVGTNDLIDSDIDPTGRTDNFIVSVGLLDEGIDAGYIATGMGNFVWNDLNHDGIQTLGEVGVPGVTVQLLLASNSSVIATTTTNANGFYAFSGVAANTYKMKIRNLPGGYVVSPQNAGGNDLLDSDISTSTKTTGNYTLSSGVFNNTVDAGIYQSTAPEMNVTGNGVTINDGDTTPSAADHTDFGAILAATGTIIRTFTIQNTTGANLTLNGSPVVALSGTNAADFSVTALPATTITAGNNTTFQVTFDPSGGGVRSAIVSISNNDSNENPYDFDIQGTGLAPEIKIAGNGLVIPDGDTSAVVADNTGLGPADIVTGQTFSVFHIVNVGSSSLDLTGASPYITFSGAGASAFSLQINPSSPIAAGDSTSFTVRFNPSSVGLKVAIVSVANSDTDENPYTFAIQGTGTSFPEIDVKAGAVVISDGDTSPSLADSTDFGSRDVTLEQVTNTFTINNSGSGNLMLTGVPIIQIYGANAGDFLVSQQPGSATVAPSGSLTFQVTFNPTTTGLRSAIISIGNSDNDENPYTFNIVGLGTSTLDEEIEVLGNGIVIESGDNLPSVSDFTDMGATEISVLPATSQFIIRNIGYSVLHLTGPPPYVSISGSHASEFIITGSPSNSIAIDSATTSFEVSFSPAGLGVRQAVLSIQNDDSDENPYTFTIQGTGIYDDNSQSEAKVTGNLIEIPSGDTSPVTVDGTDFGSIEVVGGFTASHEFVIHNLGTDDLVLGATPMFSITGAHSGDFTITSEPPSLVAPNSSVSFTVVFNPSGTGLRQATIAIDNSDLNENPYSFAIQGTGTTEPEINVSGDGSTISNGASSPGTADSTDFGDVDVSLGNHRITYTIDNIGSATLSSIVASIVGINSSDFSITTAPASSISMASNSTFVVEFDALVVGTRTATVSITSNDPDTPTYLFDIQGNGTGSGFPLSCEPNFFQVYGASGTIAYLDASTSPYTYTTLATAGYIIDGIGYNVQDGLIYGFEHDDSGWNPPEYMVRIDATGTVTQLTSINHSFASTVADFDDSGNYYFWDATGTDLRVFDASAGTVTGDIYTGGTAFLAQDMAFRSADGKFYGVNDSTLYIYNPGINSVSNSVKIHGKLNDDLVAATNGNAFGSAWSASDGYIYVANTASGRMYKINVDTNPATSIYVGQASAVSNSDGASCPVSASPLPTTGTIGDKVWLDSNGDGLQDAGEEGLAGVTVSLFEVGNGTALNSIITTSDGAYSFSSLGASQYYLTFTTPPTGFSLSPKGAGANDALDSDADPGTFKTDNIDITPGVVNTGIDAGFKATGVGDYVWLDVDEDGIQDGNEIGVPGINVEIKIDGGASIATTTTDANGEYSFTGLTANTYRLYFTNLPIGYAFSLQNQGADDALDNDIGTNGQSAAFAVTANVYNKTLDAGVFQSSEPEINVTGNGIDILDGDTSPSTADHTDFGSINAGIDSVIYTFTIHNAISGATLTLNGNPKVSLSGTAAADFVVVSAPADTVSPGASTSFDLRFIPTAEGLRTATVSIANTDANENPYDFSVRGFGLASEIQIEGNGHVIADGDTTAAASDFTDFGAEDILTGSQSQIFTIINTGNANLILTDPAPHVVLTGYHPGDFTITSAPNSPLASNNTTNFTVTFDPEAEGLRTAVISIGNNDLDENPYTFTIQGIGTATPEITIEANGELIGDGDTTPILTDNTDFGNQDISTDTQVNTFLIINTGSGPLALSGVPIVVLSGVQAGDFLISQQPTGTSVAASDTLTFEVTFDPTAVGLRSATISIANNDDDENPFNFSIQGTGVASSKIDVFGNSLSILNGDITPSVADSTVFDNTIIDSSFSIGFTIENSGSAALNLTSASPYISFSGANAGDFSVLHIPNPSIAAGGGTTEFRVLFTPSAEGARTAIVNIASDDPNENLFTFTVSGLCLPMPLPELQLTETVDLAVALPGDTLTYTVTYLNVGVGLATDVVVDQDVPTETTYVTNSASGAGMTIEYSSDGGTVYTNDQINVTNIKYTRTASLISGGSGSIVFKVIVN